MGGGGDGGGGGGGDASEPRDESRGGLAATFFLYGAAGDVHPSRERREKCRVVVVVHVSLRLLPRVVLLPRRVLASALVAASIVVVLLLLLRLFGFGAFVLSLVSFVSLVLADEGGDGGEGRSWRCVFFVDDVSAVVRRARRLGVQFGLASGFGERDGEAHRLDALEPRDGFALASEGLSGILERAVERLFEIGDGRAEETFETRALAGDGLDEYVTHVAQDVILAEGEGSAPPAARQGVPRAGDARGGARGGGLLDPATEDRAGDVQAEAGGGAPSAPHGRRPSGGATTTGRATTRTSPPRTRPCPSRPPPRRTRTRPRFQTRTKPSGTPPGATRSPREGRPRRDPRRVSAESRVTVNARHAARATARGDLSR